MHFCSALHAYLPRKPLPSWTTWPKTMGIGVRILPQAEADWLQGHSPACSSLCPAPWCTAMLGSALLC